LPVQNQFDQFKSGKVISNYNEEAQIITWSMFEAMFGERRIPRHWKCLAGLDVGYSEGMYPHYSAWDFIATAAQNSPLPGSLFLYRSRSFQGTSIDDQAEAIKTDLYPEEMSMIQSWQMSHERTGEMMTLRRKHQLPFMKFKFYKAEDGVAQWKNLSMCDHTQANPFKKDEAIEKDMYRIGRPTMYYIVDDDQCVFAKNDDGLKLLREQVSTWEYVQVKLTEAGQTTQKPSKVNDDHCDDIKSLLAFFGAQSTEKTIAELIHEKVQAQVGVYKDDEILDTGQQLSLAMARGRAIKELRKDYDIDEIGVENEPMEVSDLSGGW